MTDHTVFVYGLLKPGCRLHRVVAPFVRGQIPARVRGRLYDAGVPAARFDEDGEIEGFVLRLDPVRWTRALEVLDDLEDEGTHYRRIVVKAQIPDGIVEAYAYEYLASPAGLRDVGPSWSC